VKQAASFLTVRRRTRRLSLHGRIYGVSEKKPPDKHKNTPPIHRLRQTENKQSKHFHNLQLAKFAQLSDNTRTPVL